MFNNPSCLLFGESAICGAHVWPTLGVDSWGQAPLRHPALVALIRANFLALGCADVSPGASECETRQSWALFSEESEGAEDGQVLCIALSPPGALAEWLWMALLSPQQIDWNASFSAFHRKSFKFPRLLTSEHSI